MSHTSLLTDTLIQRYLSVLGVERRDCSFDALHEIVGAHLTRVPFENLSKLYRFRRFGLTGIPPIEVFLDGIEQYHFGGVCFANNVHFYRLLKSLGYDTKLCGGDMRIPNTHMAIVVTVEGREYHRRCIPSGSAVSQLPPAGTFLAGPVQGNSQFHNPRLQ
jgi:arylamine N-acetyltransferase